MASAGSYTSGRLRLERAWKCPNHHVYWYGDGVCRICGAHGELEKLPDNAADVTPPERAR
jgi:hypothetical protein